jgi:NADH:ubiquinone oxidoreductase subunit 5 (subunit L)/multisubunit Na+/H+ antiporter MnhA subunit
MYLTILLLPFLSFLTTNLFGRFIGGNGSNFIAPLSILSSLFLSSIAFYETVLCVSNCSVYLFSWFTTELFICD